MTDDQPRDWRGTPIVPGSLVIYGAPVGRSIALVEAEVVGFTKTGRVNVRIIRRAVGGSWSEREVVHVGADRLVVVAMLPPSDVPLTSSLIADREAAEAERKRIRATHDFPEPYREDIPLVGYATHGSYGTRSSTFRYVYPPCRLCGSDNRYTEKECPNAVR